METKGGKIVSIVCYTLIALTLIQCNFAIADTELDAELNVDLVADEVKAMKSKGKGIKTTKAECSTEDDCHGSRLCYKGKCVWDKNFDLCNCCDKKYDTDYERAACPRNYIVDHCKKCKERDECRKNSCCSGDLEYRLDIVSNEPICGEKTESFQFARLWSGCACPRGLSRSSRNGTKCYERKDCPVKVPKLRKEDEPCGSCFRAWCPDSCKDEQCGECEKGFECKQVSALREPPRRCKKITVSSCIKNCNWIENKDKPFTWRKPTKKEKKECRKECYQTYSTVSPKDTKGYGNRVTNCEHDSDCKELECKPFGTVYRLGRCDTKTNRCYCIDCPNCGRPFVIDGMSRSTSSLVGDIDSSNAKTTWNIDKRPRILANESLNQAIALEFSIQAEGEHASVASFARHTLQLMAIGAPSTLLMGSQQAGLDEIKHARMCYSIAEAFLGANIRPSTLDIDGSVKAMNKEEVIQSVINEGCIGETISAIRAQFGAYNAKQPMVKDILEEIAADESNHAQLAWNTVQWAVGRFPELRSVAKETFKAQLDRPITSFNSFPTDYCYDCERDSALRDHGLLLDEDQHNTENHGIRNVIEPALQNELRSVETIGEQIMNIDLSKY